MVVVGAKCLTATAGKVGYGSHRAPNSSNFKFRMRRVEFQSWPFLNYSPFPLSHDEAKFLVAQVARQCGVANVVRTEVRAPLGPRGAI